MEGNKRPFKILISIFFPFLVVGLILSVFWNFSLEKEINKSKEERADLKKNIEKIEILEKVGRNYIKEVLRQKAVAICFWELIGDYENKFTSKEKEDCIQLIVMTDKKYENKGIDAPIILAWVEKESGGNPEAVSTNGSKGLTQWNDYRAWKILNTMGYPGYDIKLVLDPVVNLAGGIYYLNNLVSFWEWKGVKDQNNLLFYTFYSYKWGPEKAEEMYNTNGKVDKTASQYVDLILKRREYWAKKLKYWIDDAQQLADRWENKGRSETEK